MPDDPAADLSSDSPEAEGSALSESTENSDSQNGSNPGITRRFRMALGIYAVLAVLAWFTLENEMRIATLVFLGGIAFRSWLSVLRDRQG